MNRTEHTLKSRARNRRAYVTCAAELRGKGTSRRGIGVRPHRLLAVLGLAIAAALVLTAAPAFAKFIPAGEIAGPTPQESFGQLKSESVAISGFNGHIYVADSSDGKVYDFESKTDTTPAILEGFGGGSVAVSVQNSTGDIYVADSTDAVIKKFAPDLTPITTWAEAGQLTGPEAGVLFSPAAIGSFGIAVDQQTGDLYAIDAGHEVVDVFDESGALLPARRISGEPAAFGCGGEYTDGIAIDYQSEDVLLSNDCNLIVYAFDLATGQIDTAFGDHVVPAGEPNEGEAEPNGTLSGRETPGGSFGGGYTSVATDSANGDIYVGDTGHTVVDRFDPTPTYVEQIAGVPSGSYGGLAFDVASGALYVADSGEIGPFGAVGSVKIFKEPVPEPPTVQASVANVSAEAAELIAEIDPHQLPTTYHFEYDTVPYAEGQAAHGSQIPFPDTRVGAGEAVITRSSLIQGLEPDTTYHFRIVAQNELGTVAGPDHIFTTQLLSAGSALPDDRAWEMVSPPDKKGSLLAPIQIYGVAQAAADGSAMTYLSTGPTESDPKGFANDSQVFSTRGPEGWSSRDIGTPHDTATGPAIGEGFEYRFFSSDLDTSVVEPQGGFTPLSGEEVAPRASERTVYRRANSTCLPTPSTCFTPLVTDANVPSGVKFGGDPNDTRGEVEFVGATADLSHVVLHSDVALTSVPASGGGLYEWAGGQIQLLSLLPTAEGGGPSPHPIFGRQHTQRNAISDDGSHVVWSVNGNEGLYLRDTTSQETVRLDLVQGGSGSGRGEPLYQAASGDGSEIFFTDTQRLTADSGASEGSPDLYRCGLVEGVGALHCDLEDLTPRVSGQAADVQGSVLAASQDGSSVFFAADGVLTGTERNEHGEEAQRGRPNLYLWHHGVITLIAVLSSEDGPDWAYVGGFNTELGQLTSRLSPNGRYLAFMSQRPLTGYDNRDARSGVPDQEVYLYDTDPGPGRQALICASCNPTGARPLGREYEELNTQRGGIVGGQGVWPGATWIAANVPGWTRYTLGTALYQSRYLSDSGRLFFNSSDPLVPLDSNGTEDVYEYEPPGVGDCTESSPAFGAASGGCVSLISSGTSKEESAFLDASEDGDDVFFLTTSQLSTRDKDVSLDLYDASVGGSEVAETKSAECDGDACQPPATPPSDATPGSLTFNGAGNLLECPKGKVKKKDKCVKKQTKKKHHKKKHHKKNGKKSQHRGGKKQKRANAHKTGLHK